MKSVAINEESLIFEGGASGRTGVRLPDADVREADPAKLFGAENVRHEVTDFPELSEIDVIRHFTRLSQRNFGIDAGMYPLGSCTMKYNPKINEVAANLPGFTAAHPLQSAEVSQGTLKLYYELAKDLAEISGMDAVTLAPAAGAHGEVTGLLMIAAYHAANGDKRDEILIPDSAHGTNPASATLAGCSIKEVKSNKHGILTAKSVREAVSDRTAALMMTNPNTLGLFEEEVCAIADVLHEAGALLYCDGANMNALMGKGRPGDMGADVIQFNLHKTFSTPHGGGGPGSGPVGVKKILEPFLPKPAIVKDGFAYLLDSDRPQSIGRLRAFHGNIGMLVRAYTYIRAHGSKGLVELTERAVLNANYIRAKLEDKFHVPYPHRSLHEIIFTDKKQAANHVTTMDIAKRLMDYGFHPPTVYFPLIVHAAMMIEPTETESKEEIDRFIEAMRKIADEAASEPETVTGAPHTTPVGRVDEVQAARKPRLRWRADSE